MRKVIVLLGLAVCLGCGETVIQNPDEPVPTTPEVGQTGDGFCTVYREYNRVVISCPTSRVVLYNNCVHTVGLVR